MQTSSFFTYTGPGRISIARYAPRDAPAGFKVFKPLAPGPWFKSVPEARYRKLYFAQLAQLDAAEVVAALHALAGGAEPVLLCYERAADCAAGRTFCHRHMVAAWIKQETGVVVPELDPRVARNDAIPD